MENILCLQPFRRHPDETYQPGRERRLQAAANNRRRRQPQNAVFLPTGGLRKPLFFIPRRCLGTAIADSPNDVLFALLWRMNRNLSRKLRALLALGRVPYLPTIWSNCLAGWWLGGGSNYGKLPLMFLGASALCAGGMYLNDAFDADVDRHRHPERPIPSGAISLAAVWRWGWAWLALGMLCLTILGNTAGTVAVVLSVCIVVHGAAHKAFSATPWLAGICRLWVYMIAGSVGAAGLNGWPIWCGLALALYAGGVGCLARQDTIRGRIPYWPLVWLAAPIVLAAFMNAGASRMPGVWLSLVLALWVIYCARTVFPSAETNISRTVSGLLAGIVFVDWLAVAPDCPHWLSLVFLVLFGTTLGLQRFVAAS